MTTNLTFTQTELQIIFYFTLNIIYKSFKIFWVFLKKIA